jgi:hypothetical protein
MKHDPTALNYLPQLRAIFPDTIVCVCLDTTIVALLQSIPVAWDGKTDSLSDNGWDWALKTVLLQKVEGLVKVKRGQPFQAVKRWTKPTRSRDDTREARSFCCACAGICATA